MMPISDKYPEVLAKLKDIQAILDEHDDCCYCFLIAEDAASLAYGLGHHVASVARLKNVMVLAAFLRGYMEDDADGNKDSRADSASSPRVEYGN